jgi:hypothetical protein
MQTFREKCVHVRQYVRFRFGRWEHVIQHYRSGLRCPYVTY